MVARSPDDVRALARVVRAFVSNSFAVMAVLIAVNHLLPAILALLRGGDLSTRLGAAAPPLIGAIPLAFFAGAALKLGRAFDDFVAGRFFEPRAARRIGDAGVDVACAIVASALVAPSLTQWVRARGGGPLVFDVGNETVALFAFALFVVAMGRILEQAALLKADNDAIV